MYQFDWTLNALPLEAPFVASFVEVDANQGGHQPLAMATAAVNQTGSGLESHGEAVVEPLFPLGAHAPMWFLSATGSWRADV